MSDEQTTSELVHVMREKARHKQNLAGDQWGDGWCDDAADRLEALQARVVVLEAACETAENFMRGSLKDQKGNNDEQV